MTEFPHHGVVYLVLVKIGEKSWRYVGQAQDGHSRIRNHESESYRRAAPNFLYFLRTMADEVSYLLPVSDATLQSGPLLNILEQWISLIFLALQPSELKHNFARKTLKRIIVDEMHNGINIREPLAQGFSWAEFPMRGSGFRYSPESLKREWYEIRRNLEVTPRRECFLCGDIFEGSFWNAPGWYGSADYEFQIRSVKFRIGKSWIDRCEEASIRVWCDLLPEGGRHPSTVIRGLGSPLRYNDPARRLGIKVSGVRKGDQKEGWCWVQMEGDPDKSIPRVNRLVDWLDDLDTEELRPRRWYPANLQQGRRFCGYTRHPLDVGEAWRIVVGADGCIGLAKLYAITDT